MIISKKKHIRIINHFNKKEVELHNTIKVLESIIQDKDNQINNMLQMDENDMIEYQIQHFMNRRGMVEDG